MALIASAAIREKLANKHGVTLVEVEECFANRAGGFLLDTRERHKTRPPTQWFIAGTDKGRLLKVLFIREGTDILLKSAFEPDDTAMRIYARHGLGQETTGASSW